MDWFLYDDVVLVFLLLSASNGDFEQTNVNWENNQPQLFANRVEGRQITKQDVAIHGIAISNCPCRKLPGVDTGCF